MEFLSKLRTFLFITVLTVLLTGCKMALLDPKGIIAASEKQLLIDAVLLMLIVVIPVILMSFIFVWKYRSKNDQAKYQPNWSHSTALEAVCWAIPCIIIGVLATMTWISSHKLDPYRPLDTKQKPLIIQVVALDWKWLFIYPEQHIATVNYIQIPTNAPVQFLITADAPMNSLQIPRLAGQIYAMPGMQTKLNLMANSNGVYEGFSANFSGDGFSDMKFVVKATSKKQFDAWVKSAQKSKKKLTEPTYAILALPSKNTAPRFYSSPANNLFKNIIAKYLKPTHRNEKHA